MEGGAKRKRYQRLSEQHRTGLSDKAKDGDVNSGRALLQHAMVALQDVLDGKEMGQADKIALNHLHECIREHLVGGVALDRAFCLEKCVGKPSFPPTYQAMEDGMIYRDLALELDAQKKRGGTLNVGAAQSRVASFRGCSISTIKVTWLRAGGLKKYKEKDADTKAGDVIVSFDQVGYGKDK